MAPSWRVMVVDLRPVRLKEYRKHRSRDAVKLKHFAIFTFGIKSEAMNSELMICLAVIRWQLTAGDGTEALLGKTDDLNNDFVDCIVMYDFSRESSCPRFYFI